MMEGRLPGSRLRRLEEVQGGGEGASVSSLLTGLLLFSLASYLLLPAGSEPGGPGPLGQLLAWLQGALGHQLAAPGLLGALVTCLTVAVLAYDSTGGGPGVQGGVMAGLNGGLVFLYMLFSVKIKEETDQTEEWKL